jgi:hypothetical protein
MVLSDVTPAQQETENNTGNDFMNDKDDEGTTGVRACQGWRSAGPTITSRIGPLLA